MSDRRQRPCLLGVERSLTGKRWEARGQDERLALALSQRLGQPELLGRVLAARGVTLEAAEAFLAPTLRDQLPDPAVLADMEPAVDRLAAAIVGGERVAVFGDYDVDGATSAALLTRFFAAVGGRLQVYVPDRQREGYGPNETALLALHAQGVGLVVTVDCGITAHAPLGAARAAGLDVVVVDHHAAEPELPSAIAVVNPNRLDDGSGLKQLAAVGVVFLLVVALNRKLRQAGWYADRPEPNLLQWLDLVALGTVCDVVPLTGLNRVLVAQGLKVLARRRNAGLAALVDVCRLDGTPCAWHLGFLLGPRVNAGGRVGRSDLGARLLAGDDPAEVAALAAELDALNGERRAIEAAVLAEATAQVEGAGVVDDLVFAAGEGWHPGVIGIVAARLRERFERPAIVVALGEGGIGKGSGRSVPGLDLGAAVIAARQAGLLVNGGGHPMAAGLTVAGARLGELRAFLSERIGQALARSGWRPALGIDGVLHPQGANVELLRRLESIEPCGAGNPEPRFVLPNVRVARADPVGDRHLRLQLAAEGGGRLKAIAFRAFDGPLGAALGQRRGLPVHVAGRIRADSWAGADAVQLHLEDAAEV